MKFSSVTRKVLLIIAIVFMLLVVGWIICSGYPLWPKPSPNPIGEPCRSTNIQDAQVLLQIIWQPAKFEGYSAMLEVQGFTNPYFTGTIISNNGYNETSAVFQHPFASGEKMTLTLQFVRFDYIVTQTLHYNFTMPVILTDECNSIVSTTILGQSITGN